MNAAPPSWPVIYGNRHTLPRPTAEPAVASTAPNLVAKPALELLLIVLDYAELVEEYGYDAHGADVAYQQYVHAE